MKQRIAYGFLLVAVGVLITRLFLVGGLATPSSEAIKKESIRRSHSTHTVSLFVYSARCFSSEEDQDDSFIGYATLIPSIFYSSFTSDIVSLSIKIGYSSAFRVPVYIFLHAFRI